MPSSNLPALLGYRAPDFSTVIFPTRSELRIFSLRRKMIPRYVTAYYLYAMCKGFGSPLNGLIDDKTFLRWVGEPVHDIKGKFIFNPHKLERWAETYPAPYNENELHNPELVNFMIDEFDIPANEAAGYQAKVNFAWVRLMNHEQRQEAKQARNDRVLSYVPRALLPRSKR